MDQTHPPAETSEHKPNVEDHDSPWKEALEVFFQPFMQLLYPEIAKLIDWQQPIEFLDKELQKNTVQSKNTRRYADKLVRVAFLNGTEQWILIHVEVQGHPEKAIPRTHHALNGLFRMDRRATAKHHPVLQSTTGCDTCRSPWVG